MLYQLSPGASFLSETCAHRVAGRAIFPATGFCEAFDVACMQSVASQDHSLSRLVLASSFIRPLLLQPDDAPKQRMTNIV
eukprot:13488181-Ditylum_brightwellii.AAC.1